MKILVDTNIVIDALTGREPFREPAEQIFMLAANQIEDMYITASSATDVYYLIRNICTIQSSLKIPCQSFINCSVY